jgi:hypothetical protein
MVLTRLWLILADRFELNSAYQAQGTQTSAVMREEDLGQQAMEPIRLLESE